MARYNNDDSKPKFPWVRGCRIEGNLVADPKELKSGAVAIKVAANYRNYDETGGVFYVSGVVFGNYASWALENLSKGKRVVVFGDLYGHEWEDRDGNTQQDVDIEVSLIAEDNRWFGDGDDDDRSSRRSRRTDRGSSSRRRAREEDDDDLDNDDDEEEEERPTRRRRAAPKRASESDDEDERPVRRRRPARTVGDE